MTEDDRFEKFFIVLICLIVFVPMAGMIMCATSTMRQNEVRATCKAGQTLWTRTLADSGHCVPILVGSECPAGHAKQEPGKYGGFVLCVPRLHQRRVSDV